MSDELPRARVSQMGRPKKTDASALSETLHLRCTKAEADLIYSVSVRYGLSTSAFLREGLRQLFDSASFREKLAVRIANRP